MFHRACWLRSYATVGANIDTCVKLYLFMCLVSQLYSEKYSTNHSLLLPRWRWRWPDILSLLILHMRCCFSLVFSLYGINLDCIVVCSKVLSNAGLLIHAGEREIWIYWICPTFTILEHRSSVTVMLRYFFLSPNIISTLLHVK